VTKQWLQIILIWIAVLLASLFALTIQELELRFLVFSSIAAAAIAIVSIEHLISSRTKDTVRQQVYVSAGTIVILGTMTLVSLLG
jgi:hypothetical protein